MQQPLEGMGQSGGMPRCSCCGQLVVTYKRTINSGMARNLIIAVQHVPRGEFFHFPDLLRRTGGTRADEAKLAHWALLIPKTGLRDDGSPRNGMWAVTVLGERFVRDVVRLPKYALIGPGNKLDGFIGPEISIRDALGTKFNYDDLMMDALVTHE